MRRVLLVAAAFPALALASASAPAGVAPIGVSARGFDPPTLTIQAGDTITWTNTGTLQHQIASDSAAFQASPVLQPGQSYSLTFPRQGRFAYHDELHQNLRASVTVAPAPPTVSIGSARTRVVYGGKGLHLTGRVSSHRAGEKVSIVARACGTFGSSQDDVVTGTGGFWRLVVHPLRATVFGATWGNIVSPAFQVGVAPRARLSRVPRGLVVDVSAALSLARRPVQLQRWDGRVWRHVVSTRLRAAGQSPNGTFFSTAGFRKRTGNLRALVLGSPCYVQSVSNAVRVTR